MTKAPYDGKAIKDSLDRTIILRKPNIMDDYNLCKLLKEEAEIPSCMNRMYLIIHVAKVNERVYETPQSYEECLALLQHLGREGAEAVSAELIKNLEEKDDIKK